MNQHDNLPLATYASSLGEDELTHSFSKVGVDFFRHLVGLLVSSFEVDTAFVCEVSADNSRLSGLVVYRDGVYQDISNYNFENSLSAQVLAGGKNIYFKGEDDFPSDECFVANDIKSYIAIPLRSAQGAALGVLGVKSSALIEKPEPILAVLNLYATRAYAEMDRLQYERRLNKLLKDFKVSERRIATLFDAIPEAIITVDGTGNVAKVNSALGLLLSESVKMWPGRFIDRLVLRSHAGERYFVSEMLMGLTTFTQFEGFLLRSDGIAVPVSLRITPQILDDRQHYILVLMDLTERKAHEAIIRKQSYFDDLTGVANKRMLLELLDTHLNQARSEAQFGAVLFVDLDKFKEINDSLGAEAGDRVLQRVAKILQESTPQADHVGRVGGDEFVVVLYPGGESRSSAALAAQNVAFKISAALSYPFDDEGRELILTAGIGVAMFPQENQTAIEIMQDADVAMSEAKSHGRNQVTFFESFMTDRVKSSLELQTRLHKALKQKEFCLYIQPKVDVKTGAIAGGEVLVRWLHPEDGLIPPDEFIPVLESSGFIVNVGEWILRESCRVIKSFVDEGLLDEGQRLSVNISPMQFEEDDFVSLVQSALGRNRLPGKYLDLELTETVVVGDMDEVRPKMHLLCDFDITFSLDDFGTGYSSMSYLKRLPFDVLKIDQEFVSSIHTDSDSRALVEAMVAVARQFKLKVVAEGVEDNDSLAALVEIGCDEYQGYYHSKPMPVDEFRQLLLDQKQAGLS